MWGTDMMTREQKIEYIRQKCIEVNPVITELKFGCELKRPSSARHYKVIEDLGWSANTEKVWINSVPFGSMEVPIEIEKKQIIDNNGDEWKVIGRPIRLADVLLAIGEANHGTAATSWGANSIRLRILDLWNLHKDDVSLQDDPSIDFLHELLD